MVSWREWTGFQVEQKRTKKRVKLQRGNWGKKGEEYVQKGSKFENIKEKGIENHLIDQLKFVN